LCGITAIYFETVTHFLFRIS